MSFLAQLSLFQRQTLIIGNDDADLENFKIWKCATPQEGVNFKVIALKVVDLLVKS